MNHETIRQKLFALYDGPLTEKERKLVDSHLAHCAECRKAIAEWKSLSARLFPPRVFSEASEDYFTAKVMRRLESEASRLRKTPWSLAWRWLTPLAGSCAVAAWVFLLVLPDSPAIVQPPLTMSLLNSAQVEAQAAQASHRKAVVAARTIPTFAFRPLVGQTPNSTPVFYRPFRSQNDAPADPYVQAVVYSY